MSTTGTVPDADTKTELSPGLNRLFGALSGIERLGNKLPHPFWLFWILSAVLAVVSAIMASRHVSVGLPGTDKTATVENLLSMDGLSFALGSALDNFAGFPALPVVVTALMGVAVAERSGLMQALLRGTIVRLPGKWVTFAVAFAGTVAHVTFDAAFVILIPLAALAFKSVGRSPVIGVVTAYVSVAAGYNASPLITPSDAILAGISTSAARLVDPTYIVTPLASYYWNAASSILVAVVVTVMIEKVLSRRPDSGADETADGTDGGPGEAGDLSLTPIERRGLLAAAGVAVLVIGAIAAATAPSSSPLRGEDGSLIQSAPVLNVAVIVALVFAATGLVYGRVTGSVRGFGEVPDLMSDGVRLIAPVVVLFFSIAQFLAYFKWTGIGSVVAVKGAELLENLETPNLVFLIALIVMVSIVNMLVSSGSAMWALIAPIVVPMMMYVDVAPEVAQTVFRIGDSCTNAVTPMSAYFVLALGYMQQYRKGSGIGTLASYTLPIALVLLVVWTAFFAFWYAVGLPLGPGVPVR